MSCLIVSCEAQGASACGLRTAEVRRMGRHPHALHAHLPETDPEYLRHGAPEQHLKAVRKSGGEGLIADLVRVEGKAGGLAATR